MNIALSPIESEFSATVEKSLQLADQPDSIRIPHDEVMSKARARIEAKIKDSSARRLA
jgi:hypothetical protein